MFSLRFITRDRKRRRTRVQTLCLLRDTNYCRPHLSDNNTSKGEKDRSKEDKETAVVGLKFPMDFCPNVFRKGGSPFVWQDFLEAH